MYSLFTLNAKMYSFGTHAWKHCATHQVHDIDKLKQRLTKIWHGLGHSDVIDDAMDEWHKRLWACVRAKGGHLSI